MAFKRSSSSYGPSPFPETPYQKAGQVWDDRIGSARVQAKNWRLMALGCLGLCFVTSGALVWRSMQSTVTPYVVEVDETGAARAVAPAMERYTPTDAPRQTSWSTSQNCPLALYSIRLLNFAAQHGFIGTPGGRALGV